MPESELPLWRRCENAWAAYLAGNGHLVTRLADATGGDSESAAPLMQLGDKKYRAPDLFAQKSGHVEYWEVKQRSSAFTNRVTGEPEYWVSYEAFSDYYHIARESGAKVWVVLHDSEVWSLSGKWLQADVTEIFAHGEQGVRIDGDGVEIAAWIWPASAMKLVAGPEVESIEMAPILSVEAPQRQALSDELVILVERELRRPRDQSLVPKHAGIVDLLRENSRVGLEALRRSLGIAESPRYSVMRVGLRGIDIDEVLGLMRYGIRVFLISEKRPSFDDEPQWVAACIASRLLEFAVVPGSDKHGAWVVDGRMSAELEAFVAQADSQQPYNHGQFVIVHRPATEHVLVRAGAGTGKTETMSERIVFLLATSGLHSDPRDPDHVLRLRLDEIVLVTFTRDSAREMRERIARTMMLRQRLCPQCVLPTIAWLLELSGTEIETIHTYAKKLLQREGVHVGIGPGFGISEQTLEFRRHLNDALSQDLDTLITSANASKLPASHQFLEFGEKLWDKLAGNGCSPLAGALGVKRAQVSWGARPLGLDGEVANLLQTALHATARAFAETCKRNQRLPVSELVSTSARAVSAAKGRLTRPPRYLFVDEFQDTDSEQIAMILEIHSASMAQLFVVGDVKQGIYRFRGAQGNAFNELLEAARQRNVAFGEKTLTLNFRTGSLLLDSLHPFFRGWGARGWLNYLSQDKLQAARGSGASKEVSISQVPHSSIDRHVLSKVQSWLAAFPADNDRVAVLCRTNKQAQHYVDLLRGKSISCEVRVGMDFFRTPAVQELRVFMEAMLNPSDDAALLELCSTRWFAGLATMQAPADLGGKPVDLTADEKRAWEKDLPKILTWAERLSSLAVSDNFERSDLDSLRHRVASLGRLLEVKPVLGWLMDCNSWMQPQSVLLPGEDSKDEVERLRYGRCFDHLVTLLDDNFGNAPVSPYRLLEWLRLKIATDHSEDEPDPSDSGATRVTVLTVHKAKGLEFERVIIPQTGSKFDDSYHSENIAVVSLDGRARLLWRWKPGMGEFSNVQKSEQQLWKRELTEKIAEETRLLYVAMTRAREELEIVVPPARRISTNDPDSWADLLRVARS